MTISDLALLDSNILIYSHQALSKFHTRSRSLISKGLRGEMSLCVSPQVLYEFYAVITNPKRVTNPVPPNDAVKEVAMFFRAKNILKIYARDDIIDRTLDLLKNYAVRGAEIFDLQLVATMLSNNVTRLYTYNQEHFTRFKEIEVLSP
ncbi:MAG: PIN domain-containing protein [Deltaproteobacteria bacterium]|nr:PIN domain-containing protein [Deltaproteobacteria bacterium]